MTDPYRKPPARKFIQIAFGESGTDGPNWSRTIVAVDDRGDGWFISAVGVENNKLAIGEWTRLPPLPDE